jgi:phage N-6-adenine-methyltransferase
MDKEDLNVIFSHKSDEWSTPQHIFDKLNNIYSFTLDPASDGANNKCAKHYTLQTNGLVQSWLNETVFINPPYSKTYDWVKKAHTEAKENGVTSVVLIPARTDTRYWHEYCMDGNVCSSITFIKGRLKFGNQKNCAPFPNVIVVFDKSGSGHATPLIKTMSNKP